MTAAKSRGRKYIRNRGYGGGVRTSAQAAVKSVFKQLTQSWKNLTNAQILAWNALAQTQAGKSVLGTAAKITGANLYTRLNYWIVQTGGAVTEVAQKVFLKYFYVNTKTGEKSGEMLATVKLG